MEKGKALRTEKSRDMLVPTVSSVNMEAEIPSAERFLKMRNTCTSTQRNAQMTHKSPGE